LIGIVVFMLYNNGLLIAKSATEQGQINPIIGLWGIHLSVIIIIILLYQFRQGKISSYLNKLSFINSN